MSGSEDLDIAVDPDDLSLAPLLDTVALRVHRGETAGHRFVALRVHPEVYGLIARSRVRDSERGNPLMLLSLDVHSDPGVDVDRAVLE